MIPPSHGVQVLAVTKPVDFRKQHDGLASLVQSHLHKTSFDAAVYVFPAKRADRLKMIGGMARDWSWRTNGWSSAFKWPAIRDGVLRLDPARLALFAGLDWRRVAALETHPPAAAE